MQWKQLFPPHIRERREAYAPEGRATELRGGDGTIPGRVDGSESYEVEIEYEGKRIVSAFCSRPYAVLCAPCIRGGKKADRFREK